jgi:hypothetical protein
MSEFQSPNEEPQLSEPKSIPNSPADDVAAVIDGSAFTTASAEEAVESSLLVRPSWLNPGFLGLFTVRPFLQGDVVCVYFGDTLRTAEALRLADKSYLMRLGEQCYVDSKNCLPCKARYINDCRNPCGYNVRFEKRPADLCANVVATRNISAGEELFVDYGKWYWAGNTEITPIRLSFSQLNTLRGVLS